MPLATCVLAVLLATASDAESAPRSLYEWIATAPVVVEAENLGTHGSYAEFRVRTALRGTDPPDSSIRVRHRRANRDRNRAIDKQALKFEKGLSYLLLLTPAPQQSKQPTYDLVRGPRGGKEIPLEGRDTFFEAIQRFVEIQDRNDDRYTWRQLGDMIEDTNPILIEVSLEQHLKFRRGDADLLGSLRPLLDHPSHATRERSALLIGQILGRQGAEPIPDKATLLSELTAKARRDDVVEVRVAATQALGDLDGPTIEEILEEIAEEDPDQLVRYTAERLLYDRETADDEALDTARDSGGERAAAGDDAN
jgi:hypothetical protein